MAISNEKKALAEQLKQAICLLLNTQVQTEAMTDNEIVSVAGIFPKWQAGVHYTTGQIVSYGTNSLGDPQLNQWSYLSIRLDTRHRSFVI